jgi:hypothetical protein
MTRPRRARPEQPEPTTHLSDDEIEKRLQGGSAPVVPVRGPRPPDSPASPSHPEEARRPLTYGAVAIGLWIIVFAGIRFLAPGDPRTAATAVTPRPSGLTIAPILQLLPTATAADVDGNPTVGPILDPSFDFAASPSAPAPESSGDLTATATPTATTPAVGPTATPQPVPTPTREPGATPTPSPRVSPGPTATPNPSPVVTPGPATVRVKVNVTNDDGGNDPSSYWLVTVTRSGSSSASFAGSPSGTVIGLSSGQSYSVSTVATTKGGYDETRSAGCSGTGVAGSQAACTIEENDRPVTLTVVTTIVGGSEVASDVAVSVTGSGIDASFSGSAGHALVINSNTAYTVAQSSLTDYTVAMAGQCSPASVNEGRSTSCTYTYTYSPPPSGGFALPPLVLLPWRRRQVGAIGRR